MLFRSSRSSSVLFNLSSFAPLEVTAATLYINGTFAYDSASGFERPDFTGSALLTSELASINAISRRKFDENTDVEVSAVVTFASGGVLSVQYPYTWTFRTTYTRTVVSDAALQITPVDRPNGRGLIEAFRTSESQALHAEGSTASTAVLMFYAVQNSGLSSLAPYLPGAEFLAPEVDKLQPRDLVLPEVAYAALLPIAPFFEAFVREVIVMGQALVEEAELLLRAWESQDPRNRVAAVAAALLYALPVTL